MLCDDFEAIRANLKVRDQTVKDFDPMGHLNRFAHGAESAARFFCAPLLTETAIDLADPDIIDRQRDYIFFPTRKCWVEWRGHTPGDKEPSRRSGFYFAAEQSDSTPPQMGIIHLVRDPGHVQKSGRAPMVETMKIDFAADEGAITPMTEENGSLDHRLFSAFIGALLIVLNTPRLVTRLDPDLSRLNLKRKRSGLPPLLTYTECTINPDKMMTCAGAPSKQIGGGVARHHVRNFFRIKRGKGEIVREHWRGNKARGYTIKHYAARREEDEGGDWKPPAGPRRTRYDGTPPTEAGDDA